MGIFGNSGILGKTFDLNRDGKVDCFEQAIELLILDELATSDDLDDDCEDD